MFEKLFTKLEELQPELVRFRRDLHMYPELSFCEENTPKKIAGFLREIGLEVKTNVGGRGVVAVLRGGQPGKTVALRADFDALPIQDEKDVVYKSRVPGVMHACGHDIHSAALLGVAKILSEEKEKITGNVVFIHQFAEEKLPGGAKSMIKDGCLDDVDVIYGAHVMSNLPIGQVGVREGYAMAAYDKFEIDIFGKGGHAGMPQLGIDPVVTGSQLVNNLQQIVARRVDPMKPAVITVGSINSGQVYNVIPDTAKITGTARTIDEDTRRLVEEAIGQMTKAACEGAGASFHYAYTRGYPALWNHSKEAKRLEELAKKIVAPDDVKQVPMVMGSEDFAYYVQEVPGTFFVVGGKNPEIDAVYPHHHPKFDVDERSMYLIGKLFISAVLEYLSESTITPEKIY
ncbi:M20 family metallopeptidase [Alteribacillus sp. YIM 98480]|uniref:M20 metallopeptidase family protein n=1 Tax=Alteribacillus sp. YIM 98480 TaxID=2606599 RepID=UPI00131BFE43|nr:amidohydrolase [Alteribacillus sp. YIM 98480]